MLSNKPGIRHLVEICAQKGLKQVIISPGSRNAPLTISFAEHPDFECLSIPDERVAAFFALGIAQQTRQPVIMHCTSGTAPLNYAPAIAEAFYQQIPLLVLTADRPTEWIHQGEGQSINQQAVFANFVKKSYQLPQEADQKDTLWSIDRQVCEAIDYARTTPCGPVHLNIPLQEPLYGRTVPPHPTHPKISYRLPATPVLPEYELEKLATTWNKSSAIMVLCGLLPLNGQLPSLVQHLTELSNNYPLSILTEHTSNLPITGAIHHFDEVLASLKEGENQSFKPDLLLTIGGSFISKRIKHWLRACQPVHHWHIEPTEQHFDPFQSLTRLIPLPPEHFFEQLMPFCKKNKVGSEASLWKKRAHQITILQKKYLSQIPWCDLKAISIIHNHLPANTNLHMGNSTPVRYLQLFPPRPDVLYNSNRGVAGIDGATSTAAGAARVNHRPTTILTGDISFFYDSNALWHANLTSNLRIIVINNDGGNIFRFIKGPDTTQQLKTFFETQQQQSVQKIAAAFDLSFFYADDEKGLKEQLPRFYKKTANHRPAILEIKTSGELSAEIWRNYYQEIRK